jgi:hypothetical protein
LTFVKVPMLASALVKVVLPPIPNGSDGALAFAFAVVGVVRSS